jgi:photosystem II stability/assembly factor-like uncharacterized protein
LQNTILAPAITLALCVAPDIALAGWTAIGPPGSGDVRAIAMDGNRVLYAAVDGAGVFETADGGQTWLAINTGLRNLAVRALVASPLASGRLFVGTLGGGVFRRDGGSWSAVNSGLANLSVTSLAQDVFGLALYAGTQDGGVFKSNDAGATWNAVNNGLNDVRVLFLAVGPSPSAEVFASTATDLYRSTDGGGHWVVTRAVVSSVTTVTFYLGEVGLGASPPAIYTEATGCSPLPCIPGAPPPQFPSPAPLTGAKSVDGGNTWSTYPGFGSELFAVDSFPPFAVYGASRAVFQSLDGGATWRQLESLPIGAGSTRTLALLSGPPSALLVGTSSGGVQLYGSCLPAPEALCLTGGRFRATLSWRDSSGSLQPGEASPLVGSSGAFWFFDPSNLEIVLKVLDGRSVNGHWWVFIGALSNVEYTITVTDTQTGAVRTYFNPQGQLASVADTSAF